MVQLILFVAAFIVFVLASFVTSPRVNLLAVGLALLTLALAWPALAR